MVKQVFEGVKVADLGWAIAAPMIAKYLADHGAEVIHIESATRPDSLRGSPPFKDNIPGLDRCGYFAYFHNNKYGMTLNLNHPQAVEVFKRRIVSWADVVAENFRAGVMSKWGLDYENLKKVKPEIIMISTCNQGQTGPDAKQPGQGTQLVALSGLLHITGWADGEPRLPYGAYTDIIAGRLGIAALIAALDYRRRTGKGQRLDLSQFEASLHFLAPLLLDYTVNRRVANRMGNRCPCAAPHGAYPCRGEDKWCVITVFTDAEWEKFCQAIGNPPWTKEPKFSTVPSRKENEDELDRLVGEWTSKFTPKEVMEIMQSAGISAGVVQTCEDIHQDPQLKYRHQFWELEHPVIGKYSCLGPAFILSKAPANLHMPSPCIGQHNEYVCTKILGMSDEEFVDLLAAGVFD